VKLFRIRPAGEAGHGIELSKQASHQLFGIIFRTQLIELSEHQRQRAVRVGYRPLRKVLTLSPEAFTVSNELGAVEVRTEIDSSAQNPIGADDACHATPRVDHLGG